MPTATSPNTKAVSVLCLALMIACSSPGSEGGDQSAFESPAVDSAMVAPTAAPSLDVACITRPQGNAKCEVLGSEFQNGFAQIKLHIQGSTTFDSEGRSGLIGSTMVPYLAVCEASNSSGASVGESSTDVTFYDNLPIPTQINKVVNVTIVTADTPSSIKCIVPL